MLWAWELDGIPNDHNAYTKSAHSRKCHTWRDFSQNVKSHAACLPRRSRQPTLVTSPCLRCIFWRSSPAAATFLWPQQQQHLFKCAVPRCGKRKKWPSRALWLWLAAARRVLLYTQKRNFSFLCILGTAHNKRQPGAERKESHTLQSISILRALFRVCFASGVWPWNLIVSIRARAARQNKNQPRALWALPMQAGRDA